MDPNPSPNVKSTQSTSVPPSFIPDYKSLVTFFIKLLNKIKCVIGWSIIIITLCASVGGSEGIFKVGYK